MVDLEELRRAAERTDTECALVTRRWLGEVHRMLSAVTDAVAGQAVALPAMADRAQEQAA